MKRKAYDHCIKENELIETEDKDNALAKELLALAEHRKSFWKEVDLEDKYPTLYLEGHYEIVKELATAILALDGWKALNHECLFAYLRQKKNLDMDFDYLLEFKDIRNSINYRGTKVSLGLWKQNRLQITQLITDLTEYVEEKTISNNI